MSSDAIVDDVGRFLEHNEFANLQAVKALMESGKY